MRAPIRVVGYWLGTKVYESDGYLSADYAHSVAQRLVGKDGTLESRRQRPQCTSAYVWLPNAAYDDYVVIRHDCEDRWVPDPWDAE